MQPMPLALAQTAGMYGKTPSQLARNTQLRAAVIE
jgi:hypothetical protein